MGRTYRYTSWNSNCQTCALHERYTTGKERRIKRWEHEEAVEAMEHRLDRRPEAMRNHFYVAEKVPFPTGGNIDGR